MIQRNYSNEVVLLKYTQNKQLAYYTFSSKRNFAIFIYHLSCRQMESGYGGQWLRPISSLCEGCPVPAEVH